MQELWTKVDNYFANLFTSHDEALESALQANQQAGLPAIDVAVLQGKFLELMVRISGAKRILEIGTLGGYSTLWLARGLPASGQIITLEVNPLHAKVAEANLRHASVWDRVDLRIGRAADSLFELHKQGCPPFDLIFIDADKPSNPIYLEWALKLSRPGTVLIVDNVVREGKVADAASDDPNVIGVRRFAEMVAAEPRLSATALQTVGSKGYDGFAMAVVIT